MNSIVQQLYRATVERYGGRVKFNKLLMRKTNAITPKINGFYNGSNITINIIKKYQKIPMQHELASFHTIPPNNLDRRNLQRENLNKDINLYRQLSDFINLSKPQEFVVIKFNTHPKEICVRYKKTQTLNLPWFVLWMKKFPQSIIDYCTDVHNYLRLFGPMCSVINLSNLMNRTETFDVNYTLILLSLAVFPQSDISPITRNATKERQEEFFKKIVYEDTKRELLKTVNAVDRLVYSRSRNIFNLPALQGTNSLCANGGNLDKIYNSSNASS